MIFSCNRYALVLNRVGNYLYVEASYPRLPNETARLSFSTLGLQFGCAKFWYHMSGDDIGWLGVYHVTDVGSKTLLWSMNKDQGMEWKEAQIKLLDSNNSFPSQVRGKN